MNPGSGKTILHLDRSRTSRSFDLGESLWAREFQRIAEILEQHLKMIENGGQTSERKLPNLALAIYGGYGSGKTSLLATLGDLVNSDESIDSLPKLEKIRGKLHALPILRPNVLAQGESFLYAFLAAVLRENPTSRSKAIDDSQPLLSQIEQSIQKVIGCLQVLDRADTAPEHDPIGTSVARLERHASDRDLKVALNDLISELSIQLATNNVLLLLPIDDADLAREDLFQTLDTLRRYLAHPRLVPICSFNGRLAEELLVSHFSKELQRKDGTGTEWLRFEEEIALQYLARMFPVRNRIRLGATMVRVQEAKYRVGVESKVKDNDEETEKEKKDSFVSDLLEHGSKVLYGFPEPLVEPRTKLALRPSLLRRQLQILDALHDAGVEALFTDDTKKQDLDDRSELWMGTFEKLTWAFLDAHRDVLKELGIHLEDLYSWSFKRLREWILAQLINLGPDRRGLLIEHWVHRTENRRGQVLSLLAAYAFRPALRESEQMPGEMPIGLGGGEGSGVSRRLDMSQMYIWFLNLWLGFYLPLILLRDRKADDDRESTGDPKTGQEANGERMANGSRNSDDRPASWIPTVGWDLGGAPALALHEAIKNRDMFGPGAMFLDTDSIRDYFDKQSTELGQSQLQFVLNLWCFYGYEGRRAWCAISLWRILSLIGQLLQLGAPLSLDNSPTEIDEEALTGNVEYLVRRHMAVAHQPGSLRSESEIANNGGAPTKGKKYVPFPFYRHDPSRDRHKPGDRPLNYTAKSWSDLDTRITKLSGSLARWLVLLNKRDDDVTYDPLAPQLEMKVDRPESKEEVTPSEDDDKGRSSGKEARLLHGKKSWRACLLRRLHGDNILGEWWPALQYVYTNPQVDEATKTAKATKPAEATKTDEAEGATEARETRISASRVMKGWEEIMKRHWGEWSHFHSFLKGCPLMDWVQFAPVFTELYSEGHFPIDYPNTESQDVKGGEASTGSRK